MHATDNWSCRVPELEYLILPRALENWFWRILSLLDPTWDTSVAKKNKSSLIQGHSLKCHPWSIELLRFELCTKVAGSINIYRDTQWNAGCLPHKIDRIKFLMQRLVDTGHAQTAMFGEESSMSVNFRPPDTEKIWILLLGYNLSCPNLIDTNEFMDRPSKRNQHLTLLCVWCANSLGFPITIAVAKKILYWKESLVLFTTKLETITAFFGHSLVCLHNRWTTAHRTLISISQNVLAKCGIPPVLDTFNHTRTPWQKIQRVKWTGVLSSTSIAVQTRFLPEVLRSHQVFFSLNAQRCRIPHVTLLMFGKNFCAIWIRKFQGKALFHLKQTQLAQATSPPPNVQTNLAFVK